MSTKTLESKLRDTLNSLLNDRLQKFTSYNIDRTTSIQIYSEIFLTVQEIILQVPLMAKIMSHDAVNFIAQGYYDMLELNSSTGNLIELDPNIFDKRIWASDLSSDELKYCAMFFIHTPVLKEIVIALKKRS